tara:strand:+ start:4176 stop:4544 length:369 start_codon:yes stop_codon:yes gene_type:complete
MIFFVFLFFPFFCFAQLDWVVPEKEKIIKNPYSEESFEDGKKIYGVYCWTCHGKNGDGKGPASLNLKPAPIDFRSIVFNKQTDGEIFYKLSNGRNMMMPYKHSLSEKQRWILVNYLRTFYED